jgi:diguanylate cyclase (GGDEF)-like protein
MKETMFTVLTAQLDFIFFFYGLAFVLLGVTCFAIAQREQNRTSWLVLGLFGFVHGVSEWLDLAALVVGDTTVFEIVRVAVMAISFVLLLDFARQQAIQLGMRIPGRWVFVPLLSLVAVGGALGGTSVGIALARYFIGFVGATAASLIFACLAKGLSGSERRFTILTAVSLALYAIAAGIIVPVAPIWPATVINHAWFAQFTGVPIQLVRGTIACSIVFSVWAIWGQALVQDASSERYTRYLRGQFVGTLVAMFTILVGGWMLTEFLGGIYKNNVQEEARGDIDLAASRLAGETSSVQATAQMLAAAPSVVALLIDGNQRDSERAKSALELGVKASGAKSGFILDKFGIVETASYGQKTIRPIVPDVASLSDVQSSADGKAGYQFVFDAASRKPDYYASYPVRREDGSVIGATVLKKSLTAFEADLKRFHHSYFFVDPDGTVMLSNRPQMLGRNLWAPTADTKPESAGKSGTANQPPLKQEAVDATWTTVDGEQQYVRRRYAENSRWSLIILMATPEMVASRVLGIIVTLLVTIMTLIYLFGRERRVHDSIQMDKRLGLQELAREMEFQATTDTLTGLFNRLKFNQTLATEILRSQRYQTGFSLILFDIDHFKYVNDVHGHQIGDSVLIEISRIVSDQMRETDLPARWGGEEFVILATGSNQQMAQHAAEKLRIAIGQFVFPGVGAVTSSFGVAEYIEGDTAETLIARSDSALYQAKKKGRNRVEVAAPISLPTNAAVASVA